MPDYDAFLLVSFGGPEGPADIMPFLENVTRGRGVPRDRLAEVAHHYDVFGGVSPINEQCRDLLAAIGKDFVAAGLELPLYWGNRNWHPFLADTVAQMASDGARHAIAFVTSAYGSFSSCRQYLDDIEAARAQVRGAPRIDKIRHFFNHPGFIGPVTQAARAAITALPPVVQHDAWLVFTAHSVPAVMAAASGPAGGGVAAGRRAACCRRGARAPMAAVLPKPQRPPGRALARPRHLRPARGPGRRRRPGRGSGPGGLRLRPRRGAVRPGHRGGAGGRAARPADGAGGHPRHRPALRLHDHRAGRRAPRPAGAGASARVPPAWA